MKTVGIELLIWLNIVTNGPNIWLLFLHLYLNFTRTWSKIGSNLRIDFQNQWLLPLVIIKFAIVRLIIGNKTRFCQICFHLILICTLYFWLFIVSSLGFHRWAGLILIKIAYHFIFILIILLHLRYIRNAKIEALIRI